MAEPRFDPVILTLLMFQRYQSLDMAIVQQAGLAVHSVYSLEQESTVQESNILGFLMGNGTTYRSPVPKTR